MKLLEKGLSEAVFHEDWACPVARFTMNFSSPPPAVPLAKEWRLRALAVTGNHRLPSLPDVLTLSEAGLSGIVILGWHGSFACRNA